MPRKQRKKSKLSDDMEKLKKNIDALAIENGASSGIYRQSVFLKYITTVLSNAFRLITKNKANPAIGAIFQLLAFIPSSLATATDPNKHFLEKILTLLVATTTFTLTIAAAILGALFATIVGVVVSATLTLMEGVNFIRLLINRNEANAAYNDKKLFNELVASQKLKPSSANEFKELLKIRSVELIYLTSKKGSNAPKTQLLQELNYIARFMTENNIYIGESLDEAAMILDSLYIKREEKFAALVNTLRLITPSSPLKTHLKTIRALQDELISIDGNIRKIIAPLIDLEIKKLKTEEQLAVSATDLSILSLSTLLSSITLLVSIGSLLMPPLFAPILVGIGVGLATFGLIKLIAEAIDNEEEAQNKEQALAEQKELILEEALYQHSLNVGKTFNENLTNVVENEPETNISQGKKLTSSYNPQYFKNPAEKKEPTAQPTPDKPIFKA